MYFERGNHAPMDSATAMRLQQFTGSQSISSAQFYGRDETNMKSTSGTADIGQVVNVAETLAKDFASTFISQAKDDIQTVRFCKCTRHTQVTG